MVNETMRRFGYPESLIGETEHWAILLRPEQPTLGSLVLAAKSEVRAFSELEAAAFADLALVIGSIEGGLADLLRPVRWNYLMLMMVDPHVHFHAIPRYHGERTLAGVTIGDRRWPNAPDLSDARRLPINEASALAADLRQGIRSGQENFRQTDG